MDRRKHGCAGAFCATAARSWRNENAERIAGASKEDASPLLVVSVSWQLALAQLHGAKPVLSRKREQLPSLLRPTLSRQHQQAESLASIGKLAKLQSEVSA